MVNVKAIYVKHWQRVVLTQVERNVIIKLLINCYSASYKAHDPTSYLLYLSADKFLEISNHAGCFTGCWYIPKGWKTKHFNKLMLAADWVYELWENVAYCGLLDWILLFPLMEYWVWKKKRKEMKRLDRPLLLRADVRVWAISLTAAFIEHIDHTAVWFLANRSNLICLSAKMHG